MNMDWETEGKGGDFIVYPEGTYKVCINGYERCTAGTGTKQVRWKASILDSGDYLGKPVTLHTPLTEKSLWKIARLVKACGIELSGLGKMDTESKAFNNVLDHCLRRTCFFVMDVGKDNKGRDRNDINEFRMDTEQQPVAVGITEEETPDFIK